MTPEEARGLRAKLEAAGCLDDVLADALGTIANMHYEYAVQNAETGSFLREESDGVVMETSDPSAADWDTDFEEVRLHAAWITANEGTEYHVMRRLRSEPEVAE